MHALSRRALALLVVLLLVAFALRLFRLENQSIWWDEGISLHLATSGLAEIVRDRLDNIHPPLYFFLLKGWLALAGISAFSARYLSALVALLQVPLVFAFTRYLVDRVNSQTRGSLRLEPVAWIAAALVTISPLSIIYGQEVRVYAFLPLIFIALLWLGERLITAERIDTRHLLLLGLVEWTGLHLHYIAFFGVAYIGVWGLVHFVHRRSDLLWRWIGLQVAVAVASLPWFLAVLNNWPAVQAEASAGTFATDPVPLTFLFAQVWAFQLTGLAGALGSPLVRVLVALTAVVFLALVLLRLIRWDRDDRETDSPAGHALWTQRLRLLAHWSIPLVLALVVWSLRSFSHPRYVTMYTIAFLPVVATLMWPSKRWLTRAAATFMALLLVFLSLWGLQRYFFEPGAAKADMRGVAHYLADTTATGDVIIVPDTDWSLPFEYEGPATVVMTDLGDSPAVMPESFRDALACNQGDLLESTQCSDPLHVYVVDYERGTRDWQDRLPFELERRGALLETTPFDELVVYYYTIDQVAPTLPACPSDTAAAVQFGPLALTGSWVEQGAAADSAVTVALCWQIVDTDVSSLQGALTLVDPVTMEQIGRMAMPLLDMQGRPSEAWPIGESVMTYHVLPVIPGTAPLQYDVLASVLSVDGDTVKPVEIVDINGLGAGQQSHLDQAILVAPLLRSDNPYEVEEPPRFAQPLSLSPGVNLLGAVVGGGVYRPGQTVRVGLLWQRDEGSLGGFRPELRLEQEGRLLVANDDQPVQGRYPTDLWQRGELVREVRDVRLPAEADGPVEVVLQSGNVRIPLGTIDVAGENVLLDRPEVDSAVNVALDTVAELVGFTLPDELVSANNMPTITLLWRSLSEEVGRDYAVFVHLVDDEGQLIGQHDGIPGSGTRPTSDWLQGEYIIDLHPLTLRDPDFSGRAQIYVGMYDPLTGERLLTPDGADAIRLPIELQIAPSP